MQTILLEKTTINKKKKKISLPIPLSIEHLKKMVTVIETNGELTTRVNNGIASHTTGSNDTDNERPLQFIKDYQEVDLHRSPSSKPLPEDLSETISGQILKSSIKGTFFVQIDAIEPFFQISNNQNEQINNNGRILLTLTDGFLTVKAIVNDHIPHLNYNIKAGSKLLLTDVIPIENHLLQLSHDNTRFHYGSNTYPRPRAANRPRGNGPYQGRRNSRYENEEGETSFFKRPPPKNTLMDFMTSLKISNDTESEKPKDRPETNPKRRYHHETNHSHSQTHYSVNNNNYNEQMQFQPEEFDEQLDPEDDPSHANYRERRNPLPPRLQRAQEERSRRNTNRYYDETLPPNDIHNPALLSSSSASYLRHGEQTLFFPNNSSTVYGPSTNGSTPSHLTYYPSQGPMTYNLAPSYHNQQPLMAPSYSSNQLTFSCYGPHYATSTYLPVAAAAASSNGLTDQLKTNPDNDTTAHAGTQNDEGNDSGIKLESSANEQKQPSPVANDSNPTFHEDKRREPNSRPRWRVDDMCLARWSEDGEFYYATVVDIQPPYCTVLFQDYNNYDQVHFSDLKIIPRDQQFYPYIPLASDMNVYYPTRPNYYPSTIDGCVLMPEAPPFPFNSAGTLYMYPPSLLTSVSRSNINGSQQQIPSEETVNASASPPPSKDSNDTSGVDSTTISTNDDHQLQTCSIADAPVKLGSSSRERSTSTESLVSSRFDDEQSTKGEEEDQQQQQQKQTRE